MAYNLVAYFGARRAHTRVPDPVFAQMDAANRLARGKQYEKAIAAYMEIANGSLVHTGVLTNLARALSARGRSDEAAQALAKAVELCPNYAPNREWLGSLETDGRTRNEA